MPDVPVTVILPSGGSHSAEVPSDVAVKELLPELTTSLQLPVTGPDGRPMSYRIDSKALGRDCRKRKLSAPQKFPTATGLSSPPM